jgi:hypothetical protein
MNKLDPTARLRYLLMLGVTLLAACTAPAAPAEPTPAAPPPATAAAAIPAAPTAAGTPSLAGSPPRVGIVTADRATLGRYERIELTAALTATYENPYDQAQIALSASFRAPSGAMREVPGFWDGRAAWKVRFTPDETGAWRYTAHVRDRFGTADSSPSSFDVAASDRHGWPQIASWHDPKLSSRYLVYRDGTSAGSQQDAWHAKINDYFVRNDPYRHPTTASLSGDKFWPAGYAVTDIPQIHVYAEQKDALRMGDSIADWTARMWQNQARPNVVGEFGTTNSRIDLALVHNGIWAGLASGAAITPLRWSDRGAGRVTL